MDVKKVEKKVEEEEERGGQEMKERST